MIEEKTLETQIIENATELFLTKGFKSVTMDDLASNMGMSKKTIYTYFKTKNELVNAVTDYLFDIISTGIDHICARDYNPIQELFTINDFVQKHLKNENSSPLYQLQKYYPKTHDKLIKKQFEVAHKCVLENIEKGIKGLIYREDIDPDFIARLYFLTATGIKNEDMFPKESFHPYQSMITYLDYHIHGIATPKGLNILQTIQQTRKQ